MYNNFIIYSYGIQIRIVFLGNTNANRRNIRFVTMQSSSVMLEKN